jgi:N-acetylglutamate synthase-like GNAT family acetyltransferase
MVRWINQVAIRAANAEDLPALVSLINRAFAIETFIDGTRTDAEHLSETKRKGDVLVAEREGKAVACVYVELRGERHILACRRSIRRKNTKDWED